MSRLTISIPRYTDAPIVGLPEDGRVVTVTNSELGRLPCAKQYWFTYIERLEAVSTQPMQRGIAWDEIMTDVYSWWMDKDASYQDRYLESCAWCHGTGNTTNGIITDEAEEPMCPRCDGTGRGPLLRTAIRWQEAAAQQDALPFTEEEFDHEIERLRRMATGYIHTRQGGPLQTIKIVAVQAMVARVITNPKTGRPYRPETFLTRDESGDWFMTETGELHNVAPDDIRRVTWPWYQVGAIDAVGADRQTSVGYVIDAKSTTTPDKFIGSMSYDPQLPGYCWALEPHLEHFGLSRIAGFMYDVANTTFQREPKELKWKPPKVADMKAELKAQGGEPKGLDAAELQTALGIQPGHGGFSTARSGEALSVPSWRFEAAITAAGLSQSDYGEHVDWLFENNDAKFYKREDDTIGPESMARYGRETFAKVQKIAALRRAAARSKGSDDIEVRFPRTPICTMPGGTCAFKGICSQDSPGGRERYSEREATTWSTVQQQQQSMGFDDPDEMGF